MSINNNLVVWTTDIHVSDIDPATATGRTSTAQSLSLAKHINSLEPSFVFNLGDLGDHHGVVADYENYRDYFVNQLDPQYFAIRGNHDENEDTGAGTSTNFSIFDGVFPTLPYHITLNWTAPQVQFILFHCTIIHTGGDTGFFSVSASERIWVDQQLANLPAGWKCFICSHPPRLAAFGNNIIDSQGGTELDAIMAPHASRILGYLNGHRHLSCGTGTDANGVKHVNGGAISTTGGNSNGGFMLLVYDPSANNIRLHFREAHNNAAPRCDFGAAGTPTYTKVTFSL